MIAESVPRYVFFVIFLRGNSVPAAPVRHLTRFHMDDDSPSSAPGTPYRRQLFLQCSAAFAVLSIAWPYYLLRQQPLPWIESSLLIGALAFLFACLTRQRWWWRAIHAVFAPAAVVVSGMNIAPHWYLVAFALMYLVFRGAFSTQVPLYLSSRATAAALTRLLAENPPSSFIDLGAGIGSITCATARELDGIEVTGVENSWVPWVIGRLRAIRLPNCKWIMGDIWGIDLGGYDVAYAFLSPAPMERLWAKVRREMRQGTLFVSNSFPAPNAEPAFVIDVADWRNTRLYCYRL